MSRRLEITVPHDWVAFVRECLEDKDKCNFHEGSEKLFMIAEIPGKDVSIFYVTVPAAAVSQTLHILRKNGIGVVVGRVVLTSLEFLKPDLSKPLSIVALKDGATNAEAQDALRSAKVSKAKPVAGFAHFQKARKTTEELYNEINGQANITVNTWLNLVGASVMAAGGLASNATVFVVAAMLVSPIMGPILGMTFGYRIADWPLFRAGLLNEIKMAVVAYICGVSYGLVLGDMGNTYQWPTDAMLAKGQEYTLIISIIVSCAAGIVLAVSLTSTGGNALVGSAISAGLLPPIVNAGMLQAYSFTYAPYAQKAMFYEIGMYNLAYYTTHVIAIVFVANLIFWLKDINHHFKDDDTDFNDIPSVVAHKKRLQEMGETNFEKGKAQFFAENMKDDLKEMANVLTLGLIPGLKKADGEPELGLGERAKDAVNVLTFGLVPGLQRQKEENIDGDIELGVKQTVNTEDDIDDLATVAARARGGATGGSYKGSYNSVSINVDVTADDGESDLYGGHGGVVRNPLQQAQTTTSASAAASASGADAL